MRVLTLFYNFCNGSFGLVFQLLSEVLIYGFGASLLIWEYNRQVNKEEAKNAAIEQEKQDMKDQVDNIAFTVAEQAAQIRELSRLTIALRDDLEKASKKHSGGWVWNSSSSENKSTVPVQEVDYDHKKPITKAVIQMKLHTV